MHVCFSIELWAPVALDILLVFSAYSWALSRDALFQNVFQLWSFLCHVSKIAAIIIRFIRSAMEAIVTVGRLSIASSIDSSLATVISLTVAVVQVSTSDCISSIANHCRSRCVLTKITIWHLSQMWRCGVSLAVQNCCCNWHLSQMCLLGASW